MFYWNPSTNYYQNNLQNLNVTGQLAKNVYQVQTDHTKMTRAFINEKLIMQTWIR